MLVALLVFCLVIVIHELGHFLAAKRCGIYVHEFAIGMGPAIIKKQGKETLYTIRLFPIGGYVKMEGEDEKSDSPRGFASQTVFNRMTVISAGVIMNVILAVICIFIVNYTAAFQTTKIYDVFDNFPAKEAGLQPGDKITKVNGNSILSYSEITYELMVAKSLDVVIEYERNGIKTETTIERKLDPDSGAYIVGFIPERKYGSIYKNEVSEEDRATLGEIFSVSLKNTLSYIEVSVKGFVKLVTLQLPLEYLSGPVGLVSTMSSEFNNILENNGIILSIISTINFVGVISVNLAVFNFLPLPALDGGRFTFLMFEAITRKPIPAEKEGSVHFVGFVLLMAFALFITYRDILKLF